MNLFKNSLHCRPLVLQRSSKHLKWQLFLVHAGSALLACRRTCFLCIENAYEASGARERLVALAAPYSCFNFAYSSISARGSLRSYRVCREKIDPRWTYRVGNCFVIAPHTAQSGYSRTHRRVLRWSTSLCSFYALSFIVLPWH